MFASRPARQTFRIGSGEDPLDSFVRQTRPPVRVQDDDDDDQADEFEREMQREMARAGVALGDIGSSSAPAEILRSQPKASSQPPQEEPDPDLDDILGEIGENLGEASLRPRGLRRSNTAPSSRLAMEEPAMPSQRASSQGRPEEEPSVGRRSEEGGTERG
ncbi:unnamed protein product, partial [Effrenium voratum]